MKQAKIHELVKLNEKHANELLIMCDLVQKIGKQELDAWFVSVLILSETAAYVFNLFGSPRLWKTVICPSSYDCRLPTSGTVTQ